MALRDDAIDAATRAMGELLSVAKTGEEIATMVLCALSMRCEAEAEGKGDAADVARAHDGLARAVAQILGLHFIDEFGVGERKPKNRGHFKMDPVCSDRLIYRSRAGED